MTQILSPELQERPRNGCRTPLRAAVTHLVTCFIFCLLFLPGLAEAKPFFQSREISGKVTDENNQPLSGVSVSIKGTESGTFTNDAGEYRLSAPANAVLVFTFVGMKTRELKTEGKTSINVVLQGEAYSLEEVVAIGYGVAKKKDLTGSISTIEGEELAKRNQTQVSQALQGTMPGVMVTRSNSLPGASATIRVRGITTIGNSDPLVIVDGVPVNNIDDVNADDIEDISVLKDAASASIYGSRAAAGVILITTKRPKNGDFSFEYNTNFGIEKPTSFPKVAGVKRYLEMINEFTWNDAGNNPGGEYALYSEDDVNNWLEYNKTNPNQYPVTDWTGLLINDYAPRQSHYFGLTAGSEKIRTKASVNYEKIGAMYDYRSYERVISRLNNNFTFNKFLSAQVDLAYNYSTSDDASLNPIWDAQRFAPIYAATWGDGRIGQGQNGSNAYAALHNGGFSKDARNKLMARASLEFKPTDYLSFTGVFAPQFYLTREKSFTKRIPYFAPDDPTLQTGFIAGYQNTSLSEGRSDARMITKQFLGNFNKTYGGHSVNLMAGYEDYSSFSESLGASATNYILSSFPYLDVAPLDFMRNSGNASETAYRSYFGRLLYDYDNRYFLQANIRRDGSSRFHPDYRWGNFPSISAGWAISEENFMQNNKVFSYLKLRGSWGQLGNERIGNYPYQSSIGFSNALFYQGDNVVSNITAAQVAYAIQDITWEITETANIGFDAYFLNNRLSLTAEYYRKKTRAMLLELEIPDYMGFENPQQNTGIMNTKGWDAQASWKDRVGKLRYSIAVNVSDSRTRMGDLGGIVLDGQKIIREGTEYNEWFGYISDGLFQSEDEVANSPKLYASVKPGDVKYRDIGGPDGVPDGKISPDYDRVPLGGSLPRFLYGGIINLNYGGFDFSAAFQGVGQQTVRLTEQMVKPFHSAWTNVPQIIDGNYWSVYNTKEGNENARYPRLSYTAAENNNYSNSDFWLISGAYFRLKNITVGYSLPSTLIKKAYMQDLRFFASATDLFSLNRLPGGWDPEAAHNTYISSILTLGASIKF